MKAEIVCEGVGTKEQAKMRVRIGCLVAQGFYYARSMNSGCAFPAMNDGASPLAPLLFENTAVRNSAVRSYFFSAATNNIIGRRSSSFIPGTSSILASGFGSTISFSPNPARRSVFT